MVGNVALFQVLFCIVLAMSIGKWQPRLAMSLHRHRIRFHREVLPEARSSTAISTAVVSGLVFFVPSLVFAKTVYGSNISEVLEQQLVFVTPVLMFASWIRIVSKRDRVSRQRERGQ